MTEPYQDPDPVSSNQIKTHTRKGSTGEPKKRLRNPFSRSKSASQACTASSSTVPYRNPFVTTAAAADNNDDDDDVTLVNQEISHDPDAEFHHVEERWKFKLKNRKASAPASDVGEYPRATSADDRSTFMELMEKTRGMSPEQVAEFLRARDRVDGERIMNGRKGDGYQMLAGPFMGTM
jgi:hypothetical protein